MYLEVKDVKKSYGSDAGYTQVLKGVTTSVEKGASSNSKTQTRALKL